MKKGSRHLDEAGAAARAAVRAFASALRRGGSPFTVILSGSPAISPFLKELARFKSADWGACRFYFSSEKTDGPGGLSSYGRARELFFSPAGVPDSSVVNFPPLRPRAAAALYSETIAAVSCGGGFRLAVLDAAESLPEGLAGAAAVTGGAAITLGTLADCREALFLLNSSGDKKKRTGRPAGPEEKPLFARAPRRLKKRLFVF